MNKRCPSRKKVAVDYVNYYPAQGSHAAHGAFAPTFLRVAMKPYRRGEEENYIVINTRTIQRVSPPVQIREINPATGATIRARVSDPRYGVTFKADRKLESGLATRADLVAAGIPRPPGEPLLPGGPGAVGGHSASPGGRVVGLRVK